MSAKTTIAWTDKSWNPVRGCSLVSPGCTNCYAMRQAHRFNPGPYGGLTRMTERGPVWTGKVRLIDEALEEPLHWRKPARVFVNSMSDLFHESVPFEFIARVFETMDRAKQHTFQILTKRPERMLAFAREVEIGMLDYEGKEWFAWPMPNVWLGVSVENQEAADERIPILLQTPAAVRFLSVEPLLGPVDLAGYLPHKWEHDDGWNDATASNFERSFGWNPAIGIDWVIVGGESGPGARPCSIDWIRSIVAQCKAAGVACFVKQLGSIYTSHSNPTHFASRDRKGGDPAEWPKDLRIREYPR